MIYQLDDISRAFYRKLKCDEDSLARVRNTIKHKERLASMYISIWLDHEDRGYSHEARDAYQSKHSLEVEIALLKKSEIELLDRIKERL